MIRTSLPPRTKTVLPVAAWAVSVISCSPQHDPIELSAHDRVEAGGVVEELDRAFNAGDAVRYFELYDRGSLALHAHLMDRHSRILRPPGLVERTSTVIDFSLREGRAIVLVNSEVRAKSEEESLQSHRLLVLEPEDGAVVFEIVAPPQSLEIPSKTEFECPACNYRITASADWLVLPNCQLRTGCLESVAFYSLAHRVCVNLSVEVRERAESSAKVLSLLVGSKPIRAAVRDEVEPWTPPYYTRAGQTPPAVLEGSTCTVAGDDLESRLYLATYDRVCYLIEVRAPIGGLRRRSSEIEELLAGFRLIDPEIDPAAMSASPGEGHVGGRLEGAVYEHDELGLRYSGPDGWVARKVPDFYLFHLCYDCPVGVARVHLKGLPPQPGTAAWTLDAADRMLESALSERGLAVTEDTKWVAGGGPGRLAHTRRVEAQGVAGEGRCVLQLSMDDDLLIMLEGEGDEGLDAALTTFDSLQRER